MRNNSIYATSSLIGWNDSHVTWDSRQQTDAREQSNRNPCPWWRHQMKTFSTSLALCDGNPQVTDGFPSQKTVKRSFDAFFSPPEQTVVQTIETSVSLHRAHYDVTEIKRKYHKISFAENIFQPPNHIKYSTRVSQCYCHALCNITELNVHFVRIRCMLRPIHQAIIKVNNIIHPTFSRFLWNSLCLSVKHEHKQLWLETRPN